MILAALAVFQIGVLSTPMAFADCAGMSCGPGTTCVGSACVPIGAPKNNQPLVRPNRNLTLLQPLDGSTFFLAPSSGVSIFFEYFNLSWPWVLGVAAGIGILQALVGGIEIMVAGSDSGKLENGKSKMMYALMGLLMVGLAGFILRSLNPLFFD